MAPVQQARSGTKSASRHWSLSRSRMNNGPSALKVLLSLVRVVPPTAKLQILDRRLSSIGVGADVVKQETRLGASAVVADKQAPAAVTSPHGTFDGCWDAPHCFRTQNAWLVE